MGQTATISNSSPPQASWADREPSLETGRLIPGSQRKAPGGGIYPRPWWHTLGAALPALAHAVAPKELGALLADVFLLSGAILTLLPLLPTLLHHTILAPFGIFLFLIAIHEGLYRGDKDISNWVVLAKSTMWACLLTALILKPSLHRVASIVVLGGVGFCVLFAWRWIWEKLAARGSGSAVNVLVVGNPEAMQKVVNAIRSESRDRVIKGLLPEWQLRNDGESAALARLARQEHVDEVIIASRDRGLSARVLADCSRLGMKVAVAPELFEKAARHVEILGGIPVITVHEPHHPEWELAIKRALDVLVGGAATVASGPLMCAIALAIKLDSCGPALYGAKRVGRKGAVFTCYKFRTMHLDAQALKQGLRLQNERQGAFFKIAVDPRITRVGRWLRKYSLDELPQLWNVVRGEMSLVGPRPHPVDDVERYEIGDLRRLDFTPGMTGLWQVVARNHPSFQRCVALDVEYIHRWSLLLDLRILGKTVPAVLRGGGA